MQMAKWLGKKWARREEVPVPPLNACGAVQLESETR